MIINTEEVKKTKGNMPIDLSPAEIEGALQGEDFVRLILPTLFGLMNNDEEARTEQC